MKFPEVALRLREKHGAWLKRHGANVNYTPPAVKGPHMLKPDGKVIPVWSGGKAPPGQLALTCAAIALVPASP